MTAWPGLLLAPLLALLQQSLTYSLVTPACAHQRTDLLNGVAAMSVVLLFAMTALAGWGWWRASQARPASGSEADQQMLARQRFLGGMATAVGGLSFLTGLAMWLPVWALSPCMQ
jgi:hypothetical protein